MRCLFVCFLFCLSIFTSAQQRRKAAPAPYFPPAHTWERRSALEAGLDSGRLRAAIRFAIEKESKAPRNLELAHAMTFDKEPYSESVGPFASRGLPTGIIIHRGYLIDSWGEPERVDMTFSVTKSFLATVVGLAAADGRIRSLDDTVAPYVGPVERFEPGVHRTADILGTEELLRPFSSAHNRTITWDHLLRQTSDWEGTLWGKPDWADRPDAQAANWLNRTRLRPGEKWEYNDVRVNVLALAATSVWRRPLPEVLDERIMQPIGASPTWRWTGYRNAWIVLDGRPVQAVSGGGHWGGGLFINAYDMARFGLLTLHRGRWADQQLIPSSFFERALKPTTAQSNYGYMNFFLNADGKYIPGAPLTSFMHVGNGTNIIYVDPEHELIVVARWIENNAVNEFISRVLSAFPTAKP